MYRLHFDVGSAKWVLQFCKFQVLWVTVKQDHLPLTFEDLGEAEEFVASRGIDKMYDRWSPKGQNLGLVYGVAQPRLVVG